MNKTYKVLSNIWHKGKVLYKNSRLILSEKEAEKYLEIGAIEEIATDSRWSGEYKMTKNPSLRGGGKKKKEEKEKKK
jgi:hypothetical protein